MSTFVNINSSNDFKVFIENMDSNKFSSEITEELFKKNNWYFTSYNDGTVKPKFGWFPDIGFMLYDQDNPDFEEPNDDFANVFIHFNATKNIWCLIYKTHTYNIKTVAELEMILAKEGFGYNFYL